MKRRMIILGLAMIMSGAGVFAQEFDDMYFRSKDRSQARASQANAYASNYDNFKSKHFQEPTMLDHYVNPTDSYSARNINPEYIARSSSEQASVDETNYFVEGYGTPAAGSATYNNLNNWNNYNNLNNQWNNPWYSPGYFGPACNRAWGSPYYGWGWNDPWMNPWMDPWMRPWGMRSGWNVGMGYTWGSPWGSGWNYGMGWGWGNNMWGPSWGMGGSWGMWNNWYRPPVIVVSDAARTNYAKRPSRTSASQGAVNNNTYTRPSAGTNLTSGNTGNTGGRVRSTSDEYYVRPSRRVESNPAYSGSGSRVFDSGVTRPTSGTSRSSNFSSPTRSNDSGFSSPSRSSGSSGFSAPTRSSGSSGFSAPSRTSSGSSGSSGSRRGGN